MTSPTERFKQLLANALERVCVLESELEQAQAQLLQAELEIEQARLREAQNGQLEQERLEAG